MRSFLWIGLLIFCCACQGSFEKAEETAIASKPDTQRSSAGFGHFEALATETEEGEIIIPDSSQSSSLLASNSTHTQFSSHSEVQASTALTSNNQQPTTTPQDYDTTQWLELIHLDPTIALDLRYATDNNFVGEQMYDCGRCWLRPQVARAVVKAHQTLAKDGLGLKMYDCYRPGPYQQRLWDKLPDARYVANPARGSLHSRGAAVDLTVIELDTGEELDMGTGYDFFGEAAYTTTTDLPAEVLNNREILQKALLAEGFLTIRTEWWHFNYSGPRLPLSDDLWNCPSEDSRNGRND